MFELKVSCADQLSRDLTGDFHFVRELQVFNKSWTVNFCLLIYLYLYFIYLFFELRLAVKLIS